jgi:CheY-like chemotaxis protein
MRILIAEDDFISRSLLDTTLRKWGHEVVAYNDGLSAHEALLREDAPQLAILDWMMPGKDGDEVCRLVREQRPPTNLYLILLTARSSKQDLVKGLESGADDFVAKPFDRAELRAKVNAGAHTIELQNNLAARLRELETSLAHVKQLQGILPICSYCSRVRDDQDYWQKVESYLMLHTDVQLSHAVCPQCYDGIVTLMLEETMAKMKADSLGE